jgi:hypothetical protein
VGARVDYHEYSVLPSLLGRSTLRSLFCALGLSHIAHPSVDCHIGVLGFRPFAWCFRSVTLRRQSDVSHRLLVTKYARTFAPQASETLSGTQSARSFKRITRSQRDLGLLCGLW